MVGKIFLSLLLKIKKRFNFYWGTCGSPRSATDARFAGIQPLGFCAAKTLGQSGRQRSWLPDPL
jgi:hypothetical protein